MHRGRGFAVVRGLDPADYSPEDNVVIFLGVSSYIAPKRGRQDEDGNMLGMRGDLRRWGGPRGLFERWWKFTYC